jgi:hypothetical protein
MLLTTVLRSWFAGSLHLALLSLLLQWKGAPRVSEGRPGGPAEVDGQAGPVHSHGGALRHVRKGRPITTVDTQLEML